MADSPVDRPLCGETSRIPNRGGHWKPQDVKTLYMLEATRYPTHKEMVSFGEIGPQHVAGMSTGYGYSIPEHALPRSLADKADVLEGGYLGWASTVLGGMLFGMIHLIA